MRVFLDANILFSGALPKSRMGTFLKALFKHEECLTNVYAIEGARRNLEIKFPKTLSVLDSLVKNCKIIPSVVSDLEIDLKLKDIPILGGAIAGNATHLLTGDKRDSGVFFGKTIRGVKIVSPKMLADELVQCGVI